MKLRSFFLTLAAIVAVVLFVGVGSLSWILSQSSLALLRGGGVTREPTAAILVPKQAPVMVSLLVSPDRLESFRQLAAFPGERRRSHRELKQVEKSLLTSTGLNYQSEIQPWLGEEVTLAVTSLDFDRDRSNGAQPGYLLALETKDPELAKEFLQLSFSRSAIAGTSDLVFEQYKGVNLIYKRSLASGVTNNFVASTVVGNFVVFANDIKVLRDAVNNVQVADLNLKNAPSYREALKTIVDPRIGVVYANLPAVSAWIANAPVPETPAVSQMLTVALSLQPRGLVAQTALIGVTGEDNQLPALSKPVQALAYVPANSIVTAAGTNLNQLWQQIDTGLEMDSPLQQLLIQAINRVQEPLDINLPEDIFNWVQGEYSLALVPDPDGGEPDWVFIAQKSPNGDIESAIAHLDSLAQEQGYSVGSLPLLNTNVTAWTKLKTTSGQKKGALARLDAQVRGVHTQIDNYEIFTTSVEAMGQTLAGLQNSLAGSEKFQQAIRALPPDNDGYFYFDWQTSQPLIEKNFPLIRVAEFAAKPIFNNLRSLTLSSQGSANGIRRATVFFNLG